MGCTSNIQIMAKSYLDSSVLEVTSENASYPIENLQTEQLSQRWRSVDATEQQMLSDLENYQRVSGFSLNAHNLTYGSTVRLSLYRTVTRALSITNVSSIGGGLIQITFSSGHGLTNARAGAIRMDDTGGDLAVIVHTTEVISATVVNCENTTETITVTGDPTSVSMEISYDNTEEGLTPTYGWGEQPWGMGGWYGYASEQKKQNFVAMWFDDVIADYMRVIINDPYNEVGFIEAARIMLGDSLSPTYNFDYGMGINYRSATTVTRVRSGSLISDNRPSYRTAKFTLSNMTEAEGVMLLDMMNDPANKRDSLISLYPDNTGQLGQIATILGRFITHGDLIHNKGAFQMSVNFEEGL